MDGIGDWTLSRHAIERALEMAVDPEEIREALECPDEEPYPSDSYPGKHHLRSGRLMLAVNLDDKTVITIGWNTWDGKRVHRYNRTIEEDLKRIRDN